MIRRPPSSTPFPYPTLFRSGSDVAGIQTTARRSGDQFVITGTKRFITAGTVARWYAVFAYTDRARDRKSTRLNSSHANISYAVFCLKKKKKYHIKSY